MSNQPKGIVLVGTRNQQPVVNWPGVALAVAVVAILMAIASCGFWYLLTREMPDLPKLVGPVCFYTLAGIGCAIKRGLATPVAQLRSLNRQ